MKFTYWWQRLRDAPGFKRPHIIDFYALTHGFKIKPLERWPDGWVGLWIGHWHFHFTFCRYRTLPDFNPADYDNVP
jgi:hypothetical protein